MRWKSVIDIEPGSAFAKLARRDIRTATDLQKIFGQRVATRGTA
jgi:hypothetical protein